jgi:uncharacterized zinc-type alcohol dehydrogenase-like protein
MVKALGYATKHSFSRLKLLEFEREEAGTHDVEIEVLFCGVGRRKSQASPDVRG